MHFAINHICAPKLSLAAFFAMARRLGISAVEIRNDLPDIVGTTSPEAVQAAAASAQVEILSINALYPFNTWSDDLPSRAESLADYAQACKARGLVMCPLNDGAAVSESRLIDALREMAPILRSRNLTGLVEPLGFPISSMRTKREAIRAIEAAGAEDVYRLVHDTFHHYLAGESEYFPDWTGLVHISGVTDTKPRIDALLDKHRVLVDASDRIENLVQLQALKDRGYSGPVSMEPFAFEVHGDLECEIKLGDSYAFVASAMT